MRISEAMALLDRQRTKHGDIEVYFDCPKCQVAFTPGTVEPVASVVITGGDAKVNMQPDPAVVAPQFRADVCARYQRPRGIMGGPCARCGLSRAEHRAEE